MEEFMFKKKIILVIFFVLIGLNLSAQENGFTFRPFFGGGGFTGMVTGAGGYGLGGIGEFSFLFFDNGLQVGGHIIGRGDNIFTDSRNDFGTGSIIGKLSFGGFFPNNFLRSYSFIESGVGFGGGNETTALNIIFGGGGGIDIFLHRYGSIYLEVGYLQHFINNELVGGVSFVIGSRGYLSR
jgi:hypothetical protein